MSSPLLWGPNNTSTNLQNALLLGNGTLLNSNGNKNYITYGNFANGALTGWSATGCATVTNGLPVSVGSSGLEFSATNGGRTKNANTNAPALDSTSAISSSIYALNLATTGAGAIGDGYISQAYTINNSDQAKMLSYKLSYKVASGTPDMSGTLTNTYAVAIYDIFNNSWLPVSGGFNFVQSTGVGIAQGTFQTAINTTGIQIFIYSPVAPTGTSSLLIGEVYVGPQVYSFGPAVTSAIANTPTLVASTTSPTLGTGSIAVGDWFRVGNKLFADVYIQFGTSGTAAGSGSYRIQLPNGLSSDSSVTGTSGFLIIGSGLIYDSSATTSYPISVVAGSADRTYVILQQATGSSLQVSDSSPFVWAASDIVRVTFSVPILGWSSNTQQSSDFDGRLFACDVSGCGSTSVGANTIIKFNTIEQDTHAIYSSTTGLATAVITGSYRIVGQVNVNTTSPAVGQYLGCAVQIDGVTKRYKYNYVQSTSATQLYADIDYEVPLRAGQTIAVLADTNMSSPVLNTATAATFMQISKLTGQAVVQATESVNAKATTSNTAITAGATTAIVFSVSEFDSHNQMNLSTGKYNCITPGKYEISGAVYVVNSGALSVTQEVGLIANQSGSVSKTSKISRFIAQSTSANGIGLSGSTIFNCLAGDLIWLTYVNGTGNTHTLNNSASDNFITIKRVGN